MGIRLRHIFLFMLAGWLVSCQMQKENYKNVKEPAPQVLEEPVQTNISAPAQDIKCHLGDYYWRITPLYNYSVTGLAFGESHKFLSDFSDAIAADIGLLWGENARRQTYKKVKLRVLMDHYYVRWGPGESFNLFAAANNHCLTCNPETAAKLRSIHTGDQITIRGQLVNAKISKREIENDPGRVMTWKTSTTRSDTGEGSCELIYVDKPEDVTVIQAGPPYWRISTLACLFGMIITAGTAITRFLIRNRREVRALKGMP